MKFFNTLVQKKEIFKPIDEKMVRFYSCGPTVYDAVHIGNLRAYIFNDLLKRSLIANNYKVLHCMNITDVDDKTIKKAGGKKAEFFKSVKKYEEKFWLDMDDLNNLRPTKITRATEYIEKIVAFIEDLLKKNFAYKASDGSVYFSIFKFKNYGDLARLDKNGLMAGARVSQDEYDKENPSDFALWKAWTEEDGEIFWDTVLGKGRPGWSIECSTMSMDILGETIDIHTGGVDLIFPHHENEIAQSEARTGKKFVNFWIHNEHLLVDGAKMSKSHGNFYVLDDLKSKNFSPLDFRYLVLGAHYRSKLNFTWEGLNSAKNSRERLMRIISEIKNIKSSKVDEKYFEKFMEKINDDLDSSGALAVLWEMMRDSNVGSADKFATVLEMDKILGLDLEKEKKELAPQNVINLAEDRKRARDERDFAKSDEIRKKIDELGWIIEDLAENKYDLKKK